MGILKRLSPVGVLKERRESWKPGNPAHAGLYGLRRGYIRIIKDDISLLQHDSSKTVILITSPENKASLRSDVSLPDTCKIYSFSKLLEDEFLQNLYSNRIDSGRSVWMYIMDTDSEACTKEIWREISRLMLIGRQYNIIITLASNNVESWEPYAQDAFASLAYCAIMPSKYLHIGTVERWLRIKDASLLEYHLGYEDATQIPVILCTFGYEKGYSQKTTSRSLFLE